MTLKFKVFVSNVASCLCSWFCIMPAWFSPRVKAYCSIPSQHLKCTNADLSVVHHSSTGFICAQALPASRLSVQARSTGNICNLWRARWRWQPVSEAIIFRKLTGALSNPVWLKTLTFTTPVWGSVSWKAPKDKNPPLWIRSKPVDLSIIWKQFHLKIKLSLKTFILLFISVQWTT